MCKDVFVVEEFYWCSSFGKNDEGDPDMRKDKSMPMVWFGKGAEERALKYIKAYAKLNNWKECKPCWNKQKAYRSRSLGEGDKEWFQAKQLCKLVNDYCVNVQVIDI